MAACVGAAALATACTGADDARPAASTSTTAAPTTTIHPDDGIFKVGVVVPTIGPGLDIGTSIEAAVRIAADEINDAGGISDQPVVIEVRDEGDSAASAALAVDELVQARADIIIGPTSSLAVLATLAGAVEAGVLTCAPTATALALDQFPDEGLLVRTVPSDSLQAVALAALADDAGGTRTAVMYLDDPYGRPMAERTERALRAKGIELAASAGFTGAEESLSAAVDAISIVRPDVVVVIADSTTGPTAIQALDDAAPTLRPTYIVNDAIRRPAASAQPFDADLSSRVTGASPQAFVADSVFLSRIVDTDTDATGLFAQNGYACLTLVALAARTSGSNVPSVIAAAIPAVSSGGSSCRSFAACNSLLRAGRNIDFDGPSDELSIGTDGDPATAVFEEFGFDDSGRDVGLRAFVVGRD
ncbi:MAG: ABC transporter substrate-binding protein [Ilumatobacteraceae bacterium]